MKLLLYDHDVTKCKFFASQNRYYMLNLGDNEEDCPPYVPLAAYRILLIISFQKKKKIGLTYLATVLLRMTVMNNKEKRPTRIPRRKAIS